MTHPYAEADYAAAFADFADVFIQPTWNLPLVRRPLPDGSASDASGLYPLAGLDAACDIPAGLAELQARGLTSIVLVPDPLTAPPIDRLRAGFRVCHPFKTHYLLDRAAAGAGPNKHHRYEIKRAARQCRAELVDLREKLDLWIDLYGQLLARHAVVGVSRFSSGYFARLAEMEGITALLATLDGAPVAMSLWLRGSDVAYYHLAAATEQGYRVGAAYLLIDSALQHFSDAAVIHFGGGAGLGDSDTSGLAMFKRGFSNRTITAHLCGSVLDGEIYARLTAGQPATAFFPAYRG